MGKGSEENTDISLKGEKADSRLPVDDRSGTSRAMAQRGPSERRSGRGLPCGRHSSCNDVSSFYASRKVDFKRVNGVQSASKTACGRAGRVQELQVRS